MKRYLRPLGILAGSDARRAIAVGLAQPLAGGRLAFSLVEEIVRGKDRRIVRPRRAASAQTCTARRW